MALALYVSVGALVLAFAAFYQTHLKRFSPSFSFGDVWGESNPPQETGEHEIPASVVFKIPCAVMNQGAKSGFISKIWLEAGEATLVGPTRILDGSENHRSWIPIPLAPKSTTSFEIRISASSMADYPFENGQHECTLVAETTNHERLELLRLDFDFRDRDFDQACRFEYAYPGIKVEELVTVRGILSEPRKPSRQTG